MLAAAREVISVFVSTESAVRTMAWIIRSTVAQVATAAAAAVVAYCSNEPIFELHSQERL